jgi:flagellar biosynthesis protein FlhF
VALCAQTPGATLLAFPGALPGNAPAVIAAALKAHRLPEKLAAQLLREAGAHPDPGIALSRALAARMTCEPLDLDKARGILLIGACGAGKSLVAGKIRLAAQALGRAVLPLPARQGLARLRAGAPPPDCLVVMEADGFNPLNLRARGAFGALSDIEGVEGVGVVSALGDAEDVGEIVAAFRFRRVIVTGLDRTRRLGALTAAVTGGARLAHVVRGQDGGLESLEPDALAGALLEPLTH